ncbi:MAG: 5-oxoprolinase subunit PxpB [Chthoniobacterales bacterium]
MAAFDVLPLGDGALLLRPTTNINANILLQLRERILAADLPGLTEVVVGYESLAVFGEPRALDSAAPAIRNILLDAFELGRRMGAPKVVEIPVCYDAEFALDLEAVAQRSGVPTEEVVRLHVSGEYRVRCVGFTPGFPYLSGLPAALATPRRSTPRTKVPAGSVAIGWGQTGIYPTVSPGGWNVIGRTPLQLFDPRRDPPALLRAGDQVRFRSITRAEFLAA